VGRDRIGTRRELDIVVYRLRSRMHMNVGPMQPAPMMATLMGPAVLVAG
jgi:hypothetical protein